LRGLARSASAGRYRHGLTGVLKRIALVAAASYGGPVISYEWRGLFGNAELNALHAEGFSHEILDYDWWSQLNRRSLGWVCARDEGALVGFVNVPWDGATHAFIMDTLVTARVRRLGIGTKLIAIAAQHARAAECEWLHVDFDDHLRPFYFGSCGFRPTNAGLIALDGPAAAR